MRCVTLSRWAHPAFQNGFASLCFTTYASQLSAVVLSMDAPVSLSQVHLETPWIALTTTKVFFNCNLQERSQFFRGLHPNPRFEVSTCSSLSGDLQEVIKEGFYVILSPEGISSSHMCKQCNKSGQTGRRMLLYMTN